MLTAKVEDMDKITGLTLSLECGFVGVSLSMKSKAA